MTQSHRHIHHMAYQGHGFDPLKHVVIHFTVIEILRLVLLFMVIKEIVWQQFHTFMCSISLPYFR